MFNNYSDEIEKPEQQAPNKVHLQEYIADHNLLQMYIDNLWNQLPIVAKTQCRFEFDLNGNVIDIVTYALDLPLACYEYTDNTLAKLGLITLFFEKLQQKIPNGYVVIARRHPELQLISHDIIQNNEEWRISCRLGITNKPFIIGKIRYNG